MFALPVHVAATRTDSVLSDWEMTGVAEIDGLLKVMTERGSSDLHIKVGSPPAIRLNGRLIVIGDIPPLNPEQTRVLALGMMDERQRASFENHHETDFAYSLPGVGQGSGCDCFDARPRCSRRSTSRQLWAARPLATAPATRLPFLSGSRIVAR